MIVMILLQNNTRKFSMEFLCFWIIRVYDKNTLRLKLHAILINNLISFAFIFQYSSLVACTALCNSKTECCFIQTDESWCTILSCDAISVTQDQAGPKTMVHDSECKLKLF